MRPRGLSLKRHALLANKMLIAMSGLSRMTKTEHGYTYEKHKFGIAEKFVQIKWTKSLMKQCLAYAGLCTSSGHIPLVSEEELAKAMNCSVRTVQQNNLTLETYSIITWDRIWGSYIEVTLCDYLENWLDLHSTRSDAAEVTEEELLEGKLKDYTSKGGYTSLSKEMIEELLQIDHVNAIRVAMRWLYHYEKEVNVKQESEAVVAYSEIKHVLPLYTSHKAAIRRMGEKLQSMFAVELFEKEEIIHTFYEEKRPKPSLLRKLKDGFVVSVNLVGAFDSKTQKIMDIAQTEHAFFLFENFVKSYGTYTADRAFARKMALVYGAEIMEKTLRKLQDEIKTTVYRGAEMGIRAFKSLMMNLDEQIQLIANGYDRAKKTM